MVDAGGGAESSGRRRSSYKYVIMAASLGSILLIGTIFLIFAIYTKAFADNITVTVDLTSLSNQYCEARPTLVTVGEMPGDYYPMIISLNRCGGTCGKDLPTHRECFNVMSDYIYLNAVNQFNMRNETLRFRNHTECGCRCIHNHTVCSETQVWDDKQCRCVCAGSNEFSECGENYIWNPRYCRCECDLVCNHRQDLDEKNCSCTCKNKYYKRCSRKNKILQESDCKCIDGTAHSVYLPCSALPAKWAALVIIISVCAIVIVAVDLILYCKGTGFFYTSTHFCVNKDPDVLDKTKAAERQEMLATSSLNQDEKGIKV